MGQLGWHTSAKEQYFQIYGSTGNSYTNSRNQAVLKLTMLPNDNLDGKSWGGVMRAFPTGFNNQSRKRTLEVVVRGREGRLSLDLGRVSEDISIPGINQGQPDGRLQAEILPNAGQVNNEKDAGLDGLRSAEGERGGVWECKPGCIYLPFSPENRDAGLDDWVEPTEGATEEPFAVNGTEGNQTGTPRLYDTEDLDRSGTLDTLNRFIRYNIELEKECLASDFCEEMRNGWRKYQIPLYGGGLLIDPTGQETEERILANLKMMRVWLGYLPKRVAKAEVRLARINLVGNSWEEGARNTEYEQDADRYATGDLGDRIFVSVPPAVRDSNRLQVDVINKLEERGYKQSPNTPRERDTRTDEPLPERALVLRYNNLHAGEVVSATKMLGSDPKDLTMYTRMRMEIHADSNWAKNAAKFDPDQNRVSLALRMGRDRGDRESKDYYEIRMPMDRDAMLDPEHRDLWLRNSFELPLSELYGLKNDELYRNYYGRPTSKRLWHPEREDSALVVTVVGDPNLARIDWMRLSVVVDSGATELQSGEIWINDLRLEGVDKSSGTAMRAQLQLDFSDFVNLSGNMSYTNGNFATMSQQRPSPGNATSKVDYNTNLQMFANKFMPDDWGVSLPVSLQFRGALDRPFTRPFSDLRLGGTGFWDIAQDVWNQEVSSIHNSADSVADIDASRARVYQTLQTDRVFSTSYKKERRAKDFLTQAVFERPDAEYRFSQTERTEFFNESESRNYYSKLRYDLSPFQQSSFQPLSGFDSSAWAPKFLTNMTVKPLPDKFQLVLFDFSFGRDERLVKPRLPEEPSIRTEDYRVSLSHGLDLEWRPLNFMGFGYRLDVIRDFDNEHECFDRSLFELNSSSCEEGFGAHRLLFDFDSKDRWDGEDSEGRDTAHYGQDYYILAREKNRSQTFHFDLNPNLLDWLTTSASFNSGYRHTINENQNSGFLGAGQPTHFEGNADHDIRFSTGFNPTGFLSSVGGWFGGKETIDGVKKALEKWRVRNLDLTYTVSNKYNNDNFTYWRLRNSDGADYWRFQAYQMGFLYNFGNMGSLFQGEPDSDFFDYLSTPDPLLQDNFSHNVSRSVDLQSGFTVPGLNLDLSSSLRWTRQYNLYRNPQSFSDTIQTFPEVTVSGSLGDFAKKIPFIADDLKSLTAYSNYNYREERRWGLFRTQNDENKQSHRFNPLIRLSANTQGNVRIENSVNLTLEYLQTYRKEPKTNDTGKVILQFIPHYAGYTGSDSAAPQVAAEGGRNDQDGYSIGDELSISYDVETQKGIQFWRYYVKLKNNLRMTLTGKADYVNNRRVQAVDTEEEDTEVYEDKVIASIKPEASYNFTNNVDARFWTQYIYEKIFNTDKQPHTHDLEIHGEFTMRF
jgi:cell surface protein SprA